MGIQLHLVEPENFASKRATCMDVIFVHGLGGDHQGTWTNAAHEVWPQWVADAHLSVRVMTLEYPASIGALTQGAASSQLDTTALAHGIADCFRNQSPRVGSRPCIFVCHSLGGLLIKRVLVDAQASKDSSWFRPDLVSGVMFCGTPHRGSGMANVLLTFEKVKEYSLDVVAACIGLKWVGAGKRLANTSALIKALEEDSRDLQFLNEEFLAYYIQRNQRSPLNVSVYVETAPVKLGWFPVKIVVDKGSADPNLIPRSGSPAIAAVEVPEKDHSQLVKPNSRDETVVKGLNSLIELVRRSDGAFDLNEHRRNAVARTLFKELKRWPTVVQEVGQFVPHSTGGPYDIASSWASLRETELLSVIRGLRKVKTLGSKDERAVLRALGMTLLALAIDLDVGVSDTSGIPMWGAPSFGEHEEEHFLLYSELVHATFRQWSPKLSLASDGETLESIGWRMQSQAVSDPNSWHAQAHFEHLVDQVVATQPYFSEVPKTTLVATAAQSEEWLRDIPRVGNLSAANRLASAKRLLEERFDDQLALLIEADKGSPFESNELQQKLRQHFDQLILFVFKDRRNRDAAACEELSALQVTAQQFLGHLEELT